MAQSWFFLLSIYYGKANNEPFQADSASSEGRVK